MPAFLYVPRLFRGSMSTIIKMNPNLIQATLKGTAACQHGGDMLVRAAVDTRIPVKGRAGVVMTIYTFFIQISLESYKTKVLFSLCEYFHPLFHLLRRHF